MARRILVKRSNKPQTEVRGAAMLNMKCYKCGSEPGEEYAFTTVSRNLLCGVCKLLPDEIERDAKEIAERNAVLDENDKVNIFLAENFDGYHVVGKGYCSFYDGCPSVDGADDGGSSDRRKHPVFVNELDWKDEQHYYREDVYRQRSAIENAERFEQMVQKHPEEYTSDERREELKKAMTSSDHYVGGWHVFALEPVYDYVNSGHQMQRILEEMKKRGWYVQISSGGTPQTVWSVVIERPYTNPDGYHPGGVAGDKEIVRAVAYAAARALGMS